MGLGDMTFGLNMNLFSEMDFRYLRAFAGLGLVVFGILFVIFGMTIPGAAEVPDLDLSAKEPTIELYPGDDGSFELTVEWELEQEENLTVQLSDDEHGWASFNNSAGNSFKELVNGTDSIPFDLELTLPAYENASSEEKETLQDSQYLVVLEASLPDSNLSEKVNLIVDIQVFYAAELKSTGPYYAKRFITKDIETVWFELELTNTGNIDDTIELDLVPEAFPEEFEFALLGSRSGGSEVENMTLEPEQVNDLFLRILFPIGSVQVDEGTYNYTVRASPEEGKGEMVHVNLTLDFLHPSRKLELTIENDEEDQDGKIILQPDDTRPKTDNRNTAKFNLRTKNLGEADERFAPTIEGTLQSGWDADFYEDVSGNDEWTMQWGEIEVDQTRSIWFIVHVDPEEKSGNYSIDLQITNDGDHYNIFFTVIVEIIAPERGLRVTPDGSDKDDLTEAFQPRYNPSSSSKNDVKFQLRLENTGTHADTFIPEVTINKRDWEVDFYKTSSKSGEWHRNGEEIEEGDVSDLWVFINVNDEAEAKEEFVEITIRNEDRDPTATQVRRLYIDIHRSDLSIESNDITLEVDGDEVGAAEVKDGDAIAVYLEVNNLNTDEESDAEDVYVEIFYYDKNLGKEDEANLYYLHQGDIGAVDAGSSKRFKANSEWAITEGEWKLEARVDYDEDDEIGEIKETNENNNHAVFGDLFQIIPDLNITAVRPDLLFQGRIPNTDDTVTFTSTIYNSGSADAVGARLYGFSDNQDYENLKHQGTGKYVSFNVDAKSTATVRFKWKASLGEYTSFWFEVNPICSDVKSFDASCIGDDDAKDHMIDEVERYSNNLFPKDQQLDWEVGQKSGQPVEWTILPDFMITKIKFDDEPFINNNVKITVTMKNNGTADWAPGGSAGTLKIHIFDDYVHEDELVITKAIDAGDTEEFEFDLTYRVPDANVVTLSVQIDPGKGNRKIEQLNDRNDEYDYKFSTEVSPGDDSPAPSLVSGLFAVVLVTFMAKRSRRKRP